MKLGLVIAEAALELVPKELVNHPSVRSDSRRRGVEPEKMLLDRSFHHAAMLRLKDGFKRGRPDLVHITLLSITSTPLHQEGKVSVYIHTCDDVVLEFAKGARPPKSYARFRNLMEKLLVERPEQGVIKVRDATLPRLLRSTGADFSVGLSIQGTPSTLPDLAGELVKKRNPFVILGGFPKGHFLPADIRAFDSLVRIHDRPLDAHVVAARLIYEIERSSAAEERGVVKSQGLGSGTG